MSERVLSEKPPSADFKEYYGKSPSQFVDLRLPDKKGKGRCPVVLFVHGGFWKSANDLTHAGHLCNALTKLGVATVNIEYRRLGETGGGWPFTFQDVASAADFLPEIAGKYDLDLSRTVCMGHSAGGQLSLWLALRSKISENSPLFQANPFKFRGAISLAGVVDLHRASELELGGGVVEELMGGTPYEYPGRYLQVSPIELIPSGVPMVLIHGENDSTVPFELSASFVKKAKSIGDPAKLVVLHNTGHFELIDPKSKQWSVIENQVNSLLQN